ncbi:hypothetical protein [Curtobacterium luteum]|uniref:hypothetical protein n=1 Tax=Curtobacterium luteum TaxID=33881 RepID=UPI0037F70D23
MHPANAIEILRTNPVDRSAARHLQRRQRAGELVRVRHGVFVERAAWVALNGRSRYLVRIRASVPSLRSDAVFALDSAAAIHGVPRLTRWPERVHAVVPSLEHTAHRVGLTLHAGTTRLDGRTFHGVAFASLAQTAVEVGRRGSLPTAVVALDHALRTGVPLAELHEIAEQVGPWGGIRVEHALEICDVRHESVGESYFAARAAELGCPDMVPQHEFRSPGGVVDRVDFWMPEQGIVIEFDGRQKYEDPTMLRGRRPADALWDEKRREDRVRAQDGVRGFVRVTWEHLESQERLRMLLRQHRVPCR